MNLLYVPVIVLAIALLAVLPVCADESHGTESGKNTSESYFITIEPIGDHYSGDTILMQGSTNHPTMENLLVQVYTSSYHPGIHGVSYGISQTVAIVPGGNGTTNRWSIEMNTSGWREDEYLATIYPATDVHTHDRGYAVGLFNLFSADKRPAENLTTITTSPPSLPLWETISLTPARIATPTQPAPLSAMITITAISGFMMIAGLKKDRGLK